MTKPDEVPWTDDRVSHRDFADVLHSLSPARRVRYDDAYRPVVYVGRTNRPRRQRWEDSGT